MGRCKDFKIIPFTYIEFIDYHVENGLEHHKKPLKNFIRFGGMPKRLDYSLEEDIIDYLKSIYFGIIDKDIFNSKAKINKEIFIIISKYIISYVTKEFSAFNSVRDY